MEWTCSPPWQLPTLGEGHCVEASGVSIEVYGWSGPLFVHWNGDNRKDLVIGEGGCVEEDEFPGKVRVYLDEGEPGDAPTFGAWHYAKARNDLGDYEDISEAADG